MAFIFFLFPKSGFSLQMIFLNFLTTTCDVCDQIQMRSILQLSSSAPPSFGFTGFDPNYYKSYFRWVSKFRLATAGWLVYNYAPS
ncbi:hypothetical protein Sjap_009013 [Stephania japonica]|uniref:Uncharacterized protein n=1 Tax=Stephania japonica TaxID=461633 RepID=A0AAP0JR54_9MAGN